MRIVLGILAGIVAALAIQAGIDILANQVYPATINDMWDRQQVTEAFAARPTGALILTVLGFVLAALGGGYLARRIAQRGWAAWVPAGVFVLMALAVVLAYPLPSWTWVALVVGPLVGGLIARHIGSDPEAMAVVEPAGDADA